MDIENKNQEEQLDLLTAVEHIVDWACGSGLNADFYRVADADISYLANRLNLTKKQSVLLALFIDYSNDVYISVNDLGRYVDCRTTRIIKYMADIDVLEKREFVRRCCLSNNERRISYRVPYEVVEAFKNNENYVPRKLSGLTCEELFKEFEIIFDLRKANDLTYEAACQKVEDLLEQNFQLLFVNKIMGYGLVTDDLMLLVLFSHLFVNCGDDNISLNDIEFLFEHLRWNNIKAMLNRRQHALIISKIVEWNNNDGFIVHNSLSMTEQAKDDLFGELNLVTLDAQKKRNDVIKTEEITIKKLFYSDAVSLKIDELARLLENSHYQQIRTRMEESGFRCGFACLFYGAPGTGKTETALQLARLTGRDVMQVNISQMRSMWVGESEKNIKRLFDRYRTKVKASKVAPILLFNEADAIIGKRMEGAEKSVDKMNNTIQNVILQEMETLDGIMIATTNLADNMDKAFERRFLYKIKFEKPNAKARASIWREMIPSLSNEELDTLSSRYDFSGGQIENIARRYTINNVLYGDASTHENLIGFCNDEHLESDRRGRIGF